MSPIDGAAPAPALAESVAPGPGIEPPGLRGAFRLLLAHLGDHVDLLRLELSQELSRLGSVLGFWFALALLIQATVMLAAGLIVAFAWTTDYRVHAIVGVLGALLLGSAYCVREIKALGARATRRFACSGQQLKRDLDLIRELI